MSAEETQGSPDCPSSTDSIVHFLAGIARYHGTFDVAAGLHPLQSACDEAFLTFDSHGRIAPSDLALQSFEAHIADWHIPFSLSEGLERCSGNVTEAVTLRA